MKLRTLVIALLFASAVAALPASADDQNRDPQAQGVGNAQTDDRPGADPGKPENNPGETFDANKSGLHDRYRYHWQRRYEMKDQAPQSNDGDRMSRYRDVESPWTDWDASYNDWRASDDYWRRTDRYWRDRARANDPEYEVYWKASEAYWADSDRHWDNYYRSRIGTTTDRGKGINIDRDRRGAPNQGDQGIGDQSTRPNAANPSGNQGTGASR